ncbi:MAG: hypothetical protein VXZ92_08230, partial [SAR324 cluster bacterium]|nr:hypothetical protein [SAR324 cluster bacterium]
GDVGSGKPASTISVAATAIREMNRALAKGPLALNSNYRKYLSKYFRTTLQVPVKYARSVDVEYPFSTLAFSVGKVTQGGVIPWLSNAKLIQTPTQSDSRRNCVTTSQYQHASDQ